MFETPFVGSLTPVLCSTMGLWQTMFSGPVPASILGTLARHLMRRQRHSKQVCMACREGRVS